MGLCVGVCFGPGPITVVRIAGWWWVVHEACVEFWRGGRHRRSLNDAVSGNSNYGNLTSCVVAEDKPREH
eukprot:scaffold797_cov191-Alexandrium_tamarense.AAC.5